MTMTDDEQVAATAKLAHEAYFAYRNGEYRQFETLMQRFNDEGARVDILLVVWSEIFCEHVFGRNRQYRRVKLDYIEANTLTKNDPDCPAEVTWSIALIEARIAGDRAAFNGALRQFHNLPSDERRGEYITRFLDQLVKNINHIPYGYLHESPN